MNKTRQEELEGELEAWLLLPPEGDGDAFRAILEKYKDLTSPNAATITELWLAKKRFEREFFPRPK